LAAIAIWGGAQWARLCELCAQLLAGAAEWQIDAGGVTHLGASIGMATLSVVLPFAPTGLAFAIAANTVSTGAISSREPIKPKLERLNPVAGFKRVFNKRMLFEGLKSVLKLGFFAAITFAFLDRK